MTAFVLDTNICLHILRGTLASPPPFGSYFVSAITEIELYSKPGLSASEEEAIRTLLSGVTVVQLPPEVRREAARIRIEAGLKLPDAVIVATALVLRAELLSNDRQLTRVSSLVVTALATTS